MNNAPSQQTTPPYTPNTGSSAGGQFNCNTCIRPGIIIALFVSLTILSLFLFSYSLSQIKSVTSTKQYSLPPKTPLSKSDPCTSSEGYSAHRPFAIRFGNDTKSLQCAWNYELSVPRIGGTLLIAVISVFVVVGLLIKWRIMMWIVIPMIFVLSIGFAVMGITDAVYLGRAVSWCQGGMSGAKNPISVHANTTIEFDSSDPLMSHTCHHGKYIVTPIFDWIICVWGVVSSLFVLHMTVFKWKEFERRPGTAAAAEVEMNDEDESSMGASMSKRASRLSRFSRLTIFRAS